MLAYPLPQCTCVDEVSTPGSVMNTHTLPPYWSACFQEGDNPKANTLLRTSQPSAIVIPLIKTSTCGRAESIWQADFQEEALSSWVVVQNNAIHKSVKTSKEEWLYKIEP